MIGRLPAAADLHDGMWKPRGIEQARSIRRATDRVHGIVFEQQKFVVARGISNLARDDFLLNRERILESHAAQPARDHIRCIATTPRPALAAV